MRKEIYKTDSYWIWFNIELYWYRWNRFAIRFQLWNKIFSFWDYNILKPRYDDKTLEIWFIISNKLIWIFYPKLVDYFEDYLKNFIWFKIWRLFEYKFIKKEELDYMEFDIILPKYPYNWRTTIHKVQAKLEKFYYKTKLWFKTTQYKVDLDYWTPLIHEWKWTCSHNCWLDWTYWQCFMIKNKDKFNKSYLSWEIAKWIYTERNKQYY